MNPLRWTALVVILGSGLALAWPASAQDDASLADGPASASLPKPHDLGVGWETIRIGGLELPADAFRDGAVGVYAGPTGARVVAIVMLTAQDRIVVRRAWEEATALLKRAARELSHDAERDGILDALPPPAGCLEVRRIDGTVRQAGIDTGIPAGITLCAADPDLIVLVVVSGRVGDLTGYEAADAVAALMLSAAAGAETAATPAATP